MLVYNSIINPVLNLAPQKKQTVAQAPVACVAERGPTGPTGEGGVKGQSAYEIAVEDGFVGSQQDWLDSLVGAAGQQGYTLSTIPYFIKEFEGETQLEGSQSKHSLTVPGFGFDSTPMESVILGPPKILIQNYNEGLNVSCFVSAYDFVIKSLNFQVYGDVADGEAEFNVKAAIFIANERESLFYIVPESVLTLTPSLSYSSPPVNADGEISLDINVSAGQKVAVALYTEFLSPQQLSSISLMASASGSMTILTN